MRRNVSEPSSSTAGVVEQYQGLVRSIATRIHRRLKLRIDLEDVVQLGMVGLLEAAERYDPDGGVALSTFAYHRIRGRILDDVGSMTGLSRSRVRVVRRAQAAASYAESIADGAPDGKDAAAASAYVAQAVEGVMFASDFAELVEDRHSEDEDHVQRGSPERIAGRRELRRRIKDVMADLPKEEAALLHAHYFDGRTLAAIGEEMGVSRSWACRLHARALGSARRLLRNDYGIEVEDLFRATRP